MSKRKLAAYYLALCGELEREPEDVMAWPNRDIVVRNRELEERLRGCPGGDEAVIEAKREVPFWEHQLLGEMGG
jgi:hypothetical protein